MKRNRLLIFCLLFLSFCCMSVYAQNYTIYPVPQKMTLGKQKVSLTRNIHVVAEDNIDETILHRMDEVLKNAGYTYSMGTTLSDSETNLLIGIAGSGQTVDRYATGKKVPRGVFVKAENKFDSHVLQVNASHPQGDLLVLGNAEGSAYYAFATLEQLLEQADGTILQTVTFEDYAYVKVRGIVEGFYGHTYSVDNRLDLLDYCKRYKMNTYFYGPKSDPYHTGLWRDNYPESVTAQQRFMGYIDQQDIRTLAAKAEACHVDFIWSIHPALQGGGIDFYNLNPGVDEIMVKFQHMYDLGVRHFGVSIDDMPGHPQTQHELADKVQRKLLEKYNTPDATDADRVGPLLFVPSQYALNYGTYTLPAFQSVHKDIEIVFTGYDCFSNIRGNAFQTMNDIVGRKPVMWWNNPVNDDHDDYLYMHGLTARWMIEDGVPIPAMEGLILNPMNQAQASKICLFGAADYAWNPSHFDDEVNWKASLSSILKEEPLQVALMDFIRLLSSYSHTGNGEEYAPLYDEFMNNYVRDNVPDATDLLDVMDKGYEACSLLQTLKESENKIYRLFYDDIAPWLNKVQTMTDIVRQSIRLMNNGNNLDDWTMVSRMLDEIAMLHKDKKYFLSVLEGGGTGTYETQREAQPTPDALDNFVRFLSEQLVDYVPELPARDRKYEVITNQKVTTARIDETEGLGLAGLSQLELAPDEYVGVNLKSIRAAVVEALPEAAAGYLAIEWSVNGKEWNGLVADGIAGQQMAYVRLRNRTDQPYKLPFSTFHIGLDKTDYLKAASVRTNMVNYEYYLIENVIDDNLESKFWSNRNQQPGDFIEVDYGRELAFYDIEIYFADNDQPTGTTVVQVSQDAQTWETVSRFDFSDIRRNVYTCNAQGRSGRFVRLYLEQVNHQLWFQLHEIKVKGVGVIPVATDDKGNGISLLDDSKLTAGYKGEGAGYVVYRFTENLFIDEVQIFHNSQLNASFDKPQISVLNEGKWHVVGELDAPCTTVCLNDFAKPNQLKIEWNADNIPTLYEIYVKGEPYNENVSTGILNLSEADMSWNVEGMTLSLQSEQPIAELLLIDTLGTVRGIYHPASPYLSLTLPEQGVWFVKVKKQNGTAKVMKILVQKN